MKFAINHIKVDIVLPNYNSYPFIEETIKSIINQTFTNWELFIVDGNSNYETQEILKKYEKYENIKVLWLKKNKRAGFCRNLALRNSRSEYVAFIDSDDIWEKDKLLKQLTFMEKNKYLFTYTNYSAFKDSNKSNDFKAILPPALFSFEKFIKNTSIGTSTMIIKKSAIGNVKFSDTKICEDYFFKCQILKKVNYAHCLPESLTRYRIRKNSLQSKKIRNLYWIWYINKNYNHLSFVKNLLSVICISINSLKKYGFK